MTIPAQSNQVYPSKWPAPANTLPAQLMSIPVHEKTDLGQHSPAKGQNRPSLAQTMVLPVPGQPIPENGQSSLDQNRP
jgi:hypothetical protein